MAIPVVIIMKALIVLQVAVKSMVPIYITVRTATMVNRFGERAVGKEENPTERHKKAHQRSDKDASPSAQHHTIGSGPNQAASGKLLKQALARIQELEDRCDAAGI